MEAKQDNSKKPIKKESNAALSNSAAPVAIHTLGAKGGIGKSLTARLLIDGLDAAGKQVRIAQIDRAPTLPSLYPNRTTTIEVPSTQEMRADPLAAVRAFEPWETQVKSIAGREAYVVTDVGAGPNARVFFDVIARARMDAFLCSVKVRVIALLLLTPEQSAMTQSADVAEELARVHPHANLVLVFNQRDGAFKFFPGSFAHKVYQERIVPLAKAHKYIVMPAIAAGAWPIFEAAGLTFLQVAMAEEIELAKRLGLSRAMAAALQGDVAAFLAVMWPRLADIVGFSLEAGNAGT